MNFCSVLLLPMLVLLVGCIPYRGTFVVPQGPADGSLWELRQFREGCSFTAPYERALYSLGPDDQQLIVYFRKVSDQELFLRSYIGLRYYDNTQTLHLTGDGIQVKDASGTSTTLLWTDFEGDFRQLAADVFTFPSWEERPTELKFGEIPKEDGQRVGQLPPSAIGSFRYYGFLRDKKPEHRRATFSGFIRTDIPSTNSFTIRLPDIELNGQSVEIEPLEFKIKKQFSDAPLNC